ncbi:hypothetical protein MSAN_02500300 [Mycena sanguinolenta]|uniref:Uncharacterized protein n=1 Tax=Mycena sanguinolenta TaxID=230812 RepID=A0A8H6TZ16_9AGAR|nr:hypothetical protein MSAN_02500300 [Mycena sanguinolenta]
MRFSTLFFTAVTAFFAVGVQASPVDSPEVNIIARTPYFHGNAVCYYPNGNYGACGWVLQNSDFVIALSPAHWDNGVHCGQHLNVTYNGKNIDGIVGDICSACAPRSNLYLLGRV